VTEVINPQTGEVLSPPNSSATIGKLAEALAKAQGELKPPKATKTAIVTMKAGGSYSYKYADLADTISAAQDPLSKNGLAVVQTFEQGNPALMHTTLVHSSGEWVRSTMPMQLAGLAPQAVGSLATYLRRYSYAAIVGIAAEEDDDGKGAGAQPPPKAAAPKPQQKAAAKPDLDIDPSIDASEKCPGPKYRGKVWIDFTGDQLSYYIDHYGKLLATGRLDAKMKATVATAKLAAASALEFVKSAENQQ